MGTLRVTQAILADRVLSNINIQLLALAKVQDELATGFRVNRPSDDPIATRRAIDARNEIASSEQFLDNINSAIPSITEAGTTLQRVVSIIQRTRELTLQAANGTNAQAQLDQIALEIDQLLEAMVVASNQQVNGRFIFAGNRTLSQAFATTVVAGEITAVAYQGNSASLDVGISNGIRVPTNVTGDTVFQSTVDIFNTLIGIRDDLRAGDQNNIQMVRIAELDTALEQVLQSQARLGALQNRLERVSSDTEDSIIGLRLVLSNAIDADFAETMINFNSRANALEAALNAGARVIQPTLLDFVR